MRVTRGRRAAIVRTRKGQKVVGEVSVPKAKAEPSLWKEKAAGEGMVRA